MTEIKLDRRAYRGPPRRIGSSWSAVEANPPTKDGWAEWNRQHRWEWQPERKPRRRKSVEQQMDDLLRQFGML